MKSRGIPIVSASGFYRNGRRSSVLEGVCYRDSWSWHIRAYAVFVEDAHENAHEMGILPVELYPRNHSTVVNFLKHFWFEEEQLVPKIIMDGFR